MLFTKDKQEQCFSLSSSFSSFPSSSSSSSTALSFLPFVDLKRSIRLDYTVLLVNQTDCHSLLWTSFQHICSQLCPSCLTSVRPTFFVCGSKRKRVVFLQFSPSSFICDLPVCKCLLISRNPGHQLANHTQTSRKRDFGTRWKRVFISSYWVSWKYWIFFF